MQRLFRRNESCFSVRQKAMKEQIRAHLETFLADNCQAWVLGGDGQYKRLTPGDEERISAQDIFLKNLTAQA